MPLDRDKDDLRILGMDGDLPDVIGIREAGMHPGLAPVVRAEHPHTRHGEVAGLLETLPGSKPDDVGIRGGQCDITDTQGRLVLENGLPAQAVVGCLP